MMRPISFTSCGLFNAQNEHFPSSSHNAVRMQPQKGKSSTYQVQYLGLQEDSKEVVTKIQSSSMLWPFFNNEVLKFNNQQNSCVKLIVRDLCKCAVKYLGGTSALKQHL